MLVLGGRDYSLYPINAETGPRSCIEPVTVLELKSPDSLFPGVFSPHIRKLSENPASEGAPEGITLHCRGACGNLHVVARGQGRKTLRTVRISQRADDSRVLSLKTTAIGDQGWLGDQLNLSDKIHSSGEGLLSVFEKFPGWV